MLPDPYSQGAINELVPALGTDGDDDDAAAADENILPLLCYYYCNY